MKNPKTIQELTDQYEIYLDEVIDRLWVVIWLSQRLNEGTVTNQYRQVDLDLIVIQLRKAMEVVGYMILLAHRPEFGKYGKKFRKIYNPTAVLKLLKDTNVECYPKKVIFSPSKTKGVVDAEFPDSVDGIEGWLTAAEFRKAYGEFCGNNSHAKHLYSRNGDESFVTDLKYAHFTALRLMQLMGSHVVRVDGKYMVHARANGKSGKPHVEFLNVVGPKTSK